MNYDCEPIHLFELGAVHFDIYLVNIRVYAFEADQDNETNSKVGALKEFHLTVSYQA